MPGVELVPIEKLSDREFEELIRTQTFFYNDMDVRDTGKPLDAKAKKGIRDWLVQQRKIASKGAWRIITARIGDRIAGYTVINVSPQDKSLRTHESFVWPEFRGPELRIGDRLLLKALELGKSLGYTRLWKANASTIPSNPGLRKQLERITGQPLGEWPKDYPRPTTRARAMSRIFVTKQGVMALVASPVWRKTSGIPDYGTQRGFSKFPHFMMPITDKTISAARQRVRIAPRRMPQRAAKRPSIPAVPKRRMREPLRKVA